MAEGDPPPTGTETPLSWPGLLWGLGQIPGLLLCMGTSAKARRGPGAFLLDSDTLGKGL